jgi:hypothetical protein
VGSRKKPGAHEELPHDLSSGELEGLPEEANPLLLREWVVVVEPAPEAPVHGPEFPDHPGVVDRRLHLETVSDHPGIGQEPGPVLVPVGSHPVHVEVVVGRPEGLPLLRTVSQESPAWLISRIRRSNRSLSALRGKPYSRSW